MTDRERIEAMLEYAGLNGKNFALRIGLTHPDSIYHIIRGRNGISDKLSDRIRMAYPAIERAWLILGEGPMIKPEGEDHSEPHRIPLYDLDRTAGLAPIFAGKSTPVDYISIPNLPRCDGAVRIRGESMYPLLQSGDIVMYKQLQQTEDVVWGEMYLVSFARHDEQYIALKYINSIEGRPTHVVLTSYNSHHEPMEIPLESIQFLAMVKASIRFNTMG